MENQPGNGKVSPYGNGDGNVAGGASGGGGRDFTQENRPQKSGPPGYCPQSVPAGGPSVLPAVTPPARVDIGQRAGGK